MELPDVGRQCSNEECKQLDFIPLKCMCGEYYCKEHFLPHCLSGSCPHYSSSSAAHRIPILASSLLHRCCSPTCLSSSYIHMPCTKCHNHFCIEHRFHPECPEIDPELYKLEKERWDRPREEFKIAKALIDAEVTSNLRKLQKSSSKSVTALKVQLMKLKSKAEGEKNIPTSDRIYFAVVRPNNSVSKTLTVEHNEGDESKKDCVNLDNSVYVSKTWSLGRVIDSISNILSIKNQNDRANEPKLRMFRETDGMCVSVNSMEQKLVEIIESEILVNGETILLDYINLIDIPIMEQHRARFLQRN